MSSCQVRKCKLYITAVIL